MDPTHAAIVGAIVAAGAFLQSAVGFGFGLFAVPGLVLAGFPLPKAIPLVLGAVAAQLAWGSWVHRRDAKWRMTLPLLPARVVGLAAGVALLGWVAELPTDRVKQFVGAVLLVVIGLRVGLRVEPRPRIHPAWGQGAAVVSGFLGGLVGMGGPPLVLWVTAHDWDGRAARSTIWAAALQMLPVLVGLLALRFGVEVLARALVGLAYAPVAVAGSSLGLRLGNRLGGPALRGAALGLLVLTALANLAGPLIGTGGGRAGGGEGPDARDREPVSDLRAPLSASGLAPRPSGGPCKIREMG